MKKLPCLTDQYGKKVLLKDYGDTSKYAVLCISKTDVFIKTDKRIKTTEDFIRLYGYGCTFTEETKEEALVWK